VIRADCDAVRDDLDAFADGELRGDELRTVAQHIDSCLRCTEEIDARRSVGTLIRDSSVYWQHAPAPAGLASGVVTRVRAERALSWRAALNHAVEDWHWVIVGGGAVAATFVSMLLCAGLVLMGTTKPSAESLSALGTNISMSPGAMYAEVSRSGAPGQGFLLVQLETSGEPAGMLPQVLTREAEERQLVNLLAQTLDGGGPLQVNALPEKARRQAEWLLDNITRVRRVEPREGPLNTLTVYRLHLVTNTEVTAKGLFP
jgi:anti-sigma factor (TIGR02949 family)